MTSPAKDPSIHGAGLGSSSSSPADPSRESETQKPTSTEVGHSHTPPLSPTPPFTSSGGVYEITSVSLTNLPPPPPPPPNTPSLSPTPPPGGVYEITSVSLTNLPPPPPPLTLIPSDTSSAGSSSGRKRGRDGDPSEQDPIKCVVCGKEFWSEKSYYGHLRKHPDRQWRGAYPPAEVKKLGPTLLELANQTVARMSGRWPSRGGLAIHSNPPPPPPPPPPPSPLPPPPPSRAVGGTLPFDLNMPPPPENGDEREDEGRDHGHHPGHSDS